MNSQGDQEPKKKRGGKPYSSNQEAVKKRKQRERAAAMRGFAPKNFQEGLEEAAGRNIEEGMKYFHEMVQLTWTITEAKVSSNGVENPKTSFTLERQEGDKIAMESTGTSK